MAPGGGWGRSGCVASVAILDRVGGRGQRFEDLRSGGRYFVIVRRDHEDMNSP